MKSSILYFFAFLFILSGCTNTETDKSDLPKNIKPNDTKSLSTLIATYDPPNRKLWQKPDLVIAKLGDISQKTIADIGAGSGSFARKLTEDAGKVIAIEIDPRFITYMDSLKRTTLPSDLQSKFETRLATPSNSNLKKGEADIIILINTYTYLNDKIIYLQHLYDLLPPDGQLVIVDFKKKRIPIRNPTQDLRIPLYEVENSLIDAGFENIRSDDWSLDYQYIVIGGK